MPSAGKMRVGMPVGNDGIVGVPVFEASFKDGVIVGASGSLCVGVGRLDDCGTKRRDEAVRNSHWLGVVAGTSLVEMVVPSSIVPDTLGKRLLTGGSITRLLLVGGT